MLDKFDYKPDAPYRQAVAFSAIGFGDGEGIRCHRFPLRRPRPL